MRVTEKSLAVMQEIGTTDAGNYARAKAVVDFRANSQIQGEARKGRVAEIEIAGLIIAAQVAGNDRVNPPVFDFIMVTGRGDEIPGDIA